MWNEKQKMAMKRETGHEGTLIAGSKRNAPRGSRGNKTHCFPWPCGVTTFEADFFVCLCFDIMFIFLNILIKHRAMIAR